MLFAGWPGVPSEKPLTIAIYGDSCCTSVAPGWPGNFKPHWLTIKWNFAGAGLKCAGEVPTMAGDESLIEASGLDAVFIMCGGNDFLGDPQTGAEAAFTANMATFDGWTTQVVIGIEPIGSGLESVRTEMESLQASILSDVDGTDVIAIDYLTLFTGNETNWLPDGAHFNYEGSREVLRHLNYELRSR